ncbi:MAG: hypothetical protein HZA88_09230 [Verrucomicrobia bacterium]|nr:hypothetical protein [Verrucomicrobiota bacterium]
MKNFIPKLLAALVFMGGPIALSASETRQPGHDESLYGKRLPYHKVEGIGQCMAAEVVGNRLYAIGSGNFYVLDITVPQTPKLLGQLSGLGTTRQLVIRGKIAYVTARQDGLWMVDVSDPAKPALISHYDTVEMATGIWVSGGLAFIATRCYGVEIVDVSDPRHVRHVSTLKTVEAQSCWAKDGLLYIGDWVPKKLLVADVKNPRQPVLIGEAPLDGYGDGGCLRGKFCYAATGHHSRAPIKAEAEGKGHGLDIYDVSTPTQPVFVSRVKFPVHYSIFNDMWSSRVAGDYCVVADTNNGLFVVNVRDIAKPAIVAHAQLPYVAPKEMFDPVGGVALAKDVIYAAGIYTGLYVVPAPGLAQPVVPEPDQPPVLAPLPETAAEDPDFRVYRPEGQVHAVAMQGDIAWVACGAAGIQAVKLGDKLTQASIHRGKGEVCYVSRTGNRLYTAEGKEGLAIYEIGSDLRLTELGRLIVPGQGVKQVVAPAPGRFALFHCGGAMAYIADISDPTKPKLVFRDGQVGLFYGDQLVDKLFDGRYLTAYWQRSGPAWYDISGVKPVLAGNTPDTTLYGWTDGVCPLGEKLLIIKRGKYALLDPNERRNTSDLPAYGVDKLRLVGRPSVGGNVLALSSRHQRQVWVLDIADIKHPRLKHEYSLTGHPGACAFWNDCVVIPAGYQGLLVERQSQR